MFMGVIADMGKSIDSKVLLQFYALLRSGVEFHLGKCETRAMVTSAKDKSLASKSREMDSRGKLKVTLLGWLDLFISEKKVLRIYTTFKMV
ncbi:hypothetical protein NPIL_143091 [Nephila pilipes]|uniref:Uncharacterized protein n=1 Tax=Nephila pilipes TaxID=299642 RepID=A0A8X6NLN0_NEPPI|nr:hypothetical protein NPIL_143091 [Nephila pilipes]